MLAIDGVLPDNDDVRRDIEELCSSTYGMKVRMVISMDDTAVQHFTMSGTGRKGTAIGRAAVNVEVKSLNDAEFGAALRVLWEEHRVGFVPGVRPWTTVLGTECRQAFDRFHPVVDDGAISGAVHELPHAAST